MNRNPRARVLTFILAFLTASVTGGAALGDDSNGIAVCTEPGDQLGPVIVSDGAGGAIVAWHDFRPTVSAGGVCFAQRVNAAGNPQWALNGVALSTTGDPGSPPGDPPAPAIAPDAAGGAFLAFGGSSAPPHAQWVNAAGAPQWGADGVQLTAASPTMRDLAIARDVGGAGGAIVVWRQDDGAGGNADIYAQKVNAAGTIQWNASGVAVTSTSANSEAHPVLISDGSGGAIIAWFNGTDGCRAQRLNASGVSQWSNTPLSNLSNNRPPAIVTDGSGGAIVAWASGNTGIYAQRVTSAGNKLWPSSNTGLQLCTAGNQCAMIPDGAGGATVTWQDFRTTTNYDIYAQSVDGAGSPQWITNGVPVCTFHDNQLAPMMVTDGGTGAIITWYDGRTPFSGDDIYVQRIDANGASQWTPDGMALCTAPDDQQDPSIAPDGVGGAFVSWQDRRSGSQYDIYVQHLDSGGQALSAPGEHVAPSTARVWPNPFFDRVRLDFVLTTAAKVGLEVLDVDGRCVRAYAPGFMTAGEHVLAWDGRSSDGRPVRQGVYFLRATGPGVAVSRAVVRLE